MNGAQRIAAERERQITVEGYTPDHDDRYLTGALAHAAIRYIAQTRSAPDLRTMAWTYWPWDEEWWKPSTDPIRNLEKAGALIAAEIDRLQRLETT